MRQTILLHDPVASQVKISNDEGASWQPVPNVPQGTAIRLIQHPFNNDMAFIIGKEGTNYATFNRGASWGTWSFGDTRGREASLSSDSVMSFHATQKEWILIQVKACEDTSLGRWGSGGQSCWDETWYTQDAFRSPPQLLLEQTSSCVFARGSKTFTAGAESRILCIAFDGANHKDSGGWRSVAESRLYESDEWFAEGRKRFVDLGIGKRARGVVGLGVVGGYIVVALKDPDATSPSASDPMHLYTSTDARTFHLARFPHSALPTLKENSYTVVESTTHSLAIDILTDPRASVGTLFVSDQEGVYFVQALEGTNRNDVGIVDYEGITGESFRPTCPSERKTDVS